MNSPSTPSNLNQQASELTPKQFFTPQIFKYPVFLRYQKGNRAFSQKQGKKASKRKEKKKISGFANSALQNKGKPKMRNLRRKSMRKGKRAGSRKDQTKSFSIGSSPKRGHNIGKASINSAYQIDKSRGTSHKMNLSQNLNRKRSKSRKASKEFDIDLIPTRNEGTSSLINSFQKKSLLEIKYYAQQYFDSLTAAGKVKLAYDLLREALHIQRARRH